MPAESRVNRICDQLEIVLSAISAKKQATKWWTSPASAHRSLMLSDLTVDERPRIAIRVLEWTSTPTSAGRHDATLRIGCTCILDDADDAESAMHRLVRDIIVAVTDDEALGGMVVTIVPVHYELETEMMSKSGLGVATVTLEAFYTWDHGAP